MAAPLRGWRASGGGWGCELYCHHPLPLDTRATTTTTTNASTGAHASARQGGCTQPTEHAPPTTRSVLCGGWCQPPQAWRPGTSGGRVGAQALNTTHHRSTPPPHTHTHTQACGRLALVSGGQLGRHTRHTRTPHKHHSFQSRHPNSQRLHYHHAKLVPFWGPRARLFRRRRRRNLANDDDTAKIHTSTWGHYLCHCVNDIDPPSASNFQAGG